MTKVPEELDREAFISLLLVLDECKRKRVLSYRKREDQIRCILADNLARYLIAREYGAKSKDILFEYNEYGKPLVKGKKECYFNISHSGEYVICAISHTVVGCDIQHMQPCDIAIGNLIFTKQEQELVHSEEDFYRMWTLKEALLKAIGVGISAEGILINMVSNGIVTDVSYKKEKYYFRQFANAPKGYSLSLWAADNHIDSKIWELDYKAICGTL